MEKQKKKKLPSLSPRIACCFYHPSHLHLKDKKNEAFIKKAILNLEKDYFVRITLILI